MDVQTEKLEDGWADSRTDGLSNRRADGLADGQTEKAVLFLYGFVKSMVVCRCFCLSSVSCC